MTGWKQFPGVLGKVLKRRAIRWGRCHRRVVNTVLVVLAVACGPTSQLKHKFGEPGEPALKLRSQQTTSLDQGLVILFSTPSGDVAGQPEISVSFNHPMKELGKADQDPYLDGLVPFKLEPSLEGEYRWMGSRTVQFAPGQPIPQATEFRATVPAGLRSLTGKVLEKDHVWTFRTPPPQVVSTQPYADEQWATPESEIDLYFNQQVDPAEVERRATLTVRGKEVGFKVRRREKGDAKSVKVVPLDRLPLDSDVELVIDEGLPGMEGPLPMTEPFSLRFRTYGDLRIVNVTCWSDVSGTSQLECDPESPVELELSNPVETKDLEKFVSVSPSVKGLEFDKWSARTRYVSVYPVGHWKPGTKYDLVLSPKLVDVFGQKLVGKATRRFTTVDFHPRWTLKFDGGLLENGGSQVMPVSVLNVDSLDATLLYEGREDRVVALVEKVRSYGTEWMESDKSATRLPLSFPKVKNRSVHAKLDISKVTKGASTGVVVMRVQNPDDRWDYDSRIVRISGLGITAKVSGDRVLAWVTDLATGEAVEGARVAIRDRQGKLLWEDRTGKGGVASVDGSELWTDWYSLPWEERCPYVFASRDGDFNYTSACGGDEISPWQFDVYHDENAGQRRLVGLVFTDRGVYRRGEKVKLKGILRHLEKGRLSVPGKERFEIRVTDSRGEEIWKKTVGLNEYGGFSVGVKLPVGGHVGYHSISVQPEDWDGSSRMAVYGSFDVQEYRAPTFEVDVDAVDAEVIRGDKARFVAHGEFLFGAPMAGSEASWYASGSEGWFDPPGWDGFEFDDGEYWYGSEWDDSYLGLTRSGDGVLDGQGGLAFDFSTDLERMNGPVDFVVESTVTGPDLQVVTGRTSVRVHPASFYVGLSVEEGFVAAGKDVDVSVVAVSPGGAAVQGRKVKLSLVRREWQYVQSEGMYEDSYGSWKPHDTVIDKCKAVTSTQPATCTFRIPKAGRYIVRAEARDGSKRETSASTGLWAWGGGSVSWMGTDELAVKMHADREVYAVGDKARILVENPFPEAEALVTVEHHGIADVRRMRMTDRAALVTVDVTDDMRPNVYVSVALVRGRTKEPPKKGGPDPGKPAVRMGYLNLSVGLEDRRLAVDVAPDREEYRPGDEVEVSVQVRDHEGKGKQAEVTLFVVDEAVLMLTGYQAPDPIGHFYKARYLGVSNSDSRMSILVRRQFGTDKGEVGGGGWEDAAPTEVRKDFRTTVYFKPDLVTDASGRARASFTLPDSLTRFRIMAVASTKDDSFGRGRADFRVSKPLLLKPAMPRFARVGDRFEAGVVVHDGGGGSGQVTVTAAAEGIELGGEPRRDVLLPAGGSVLVRFPFEARSAGVAEVTFRVKGGEFEDAVLVKRPVHLPVVMETVATYGDTTSTAVEGIGELEGVIPDAGGLKVRMSSTAFVGLDRAIESLVRYPYGCAEQLTSRLVPMVALGDMIETFGLDIEMDRQRLGETVKTLQQMQHYSGGWGYFAGAGCPYPWLSAYVLWGLDQADERGYDVDEGVLDSGAAFLRDVLRDGGWCWPMPAWWSEVGLATKAYIVYVLAEVGQPETSYHDYLYEHRAELPIFARLLLAGAIHASNGDGDQVKELMREVTNEVKQTASSAHLVENLGDGYRAIMHSQVRDTALALDVLLAVDPDHPLVSKMARWLMEARREDGTWGNTQNDAWSLLAMADYLDVREAEEPDFVAEVFLGKTPLVSATFEGRSLEEQTGFVSMEKLLGAGPGFLGFAKTGDGRLYYSASLSYARDSLPEEPIDRGFFVERSYTVLAGGVPVVQTPAPGSALGKMKAGENVIVELTLVVTGKRHFVAFEDPVPAGLEVVNFRFDTSSMQDMQALGSSWGWNPFYHSEILDDRVMFFADDIQPGIHRLRYLARATTPGEFVVAPATAHEMYQPEVFGRTGAGAFVVEP